MCSAAVNSFDYVFFTCISPPLSLSLCLSLFFFPIYTTRDIARVVDEAAVFIGRSVRINKRE